MSNEKQLSIKRGMFIAALNYVEDICRPNNAQPTQEQLNMIIKAHKELNALEKEMGIELTLIPEDFDIKYLP